VRCPTIGVRVGGGFYSRREASGALRRFVKLSPYLECPVKPNVPKVPKVPLSKSLQDARSIPVPGAGRPWRLIISHWALFGWGNCRESSGRTAQDIPSCAYNLQIDHLVVFQALGVALGEAGEEMPPVPGRHKASPQVKP